MPSLILAHCCDSGQLQSILISQLRYVVVTWLLSWPWQEPLVEWLVAGVT